MQRPTALPMIPASASGVSTQRSGPKRSRSPAVARKTPPARPTSSPMTMTSSSRASSTWKQSLIASTTVSSAKDPPQLVEIAPERRRRVDERVLEEQCRVGGRLRLGGGNARTHQIDRLRAHLLDVLVGQHTEALEVGLVAADALALALLLHPLHVD